MTHDLDTRARRAASGLQAAVAATDLQSVPPGVKPRRRALLMVLRPAWVAALLLLGSAVGLALVLDSSPPTTTNPPPAPATSVVITTPSTVAPDPAPPTSAAAVPVAPTTTATTTTPTTIAPDLEPPPLQITSPEDGAELAEKTVTFAGTTEPGARVFAGKYEAEVDASGEWRIVLVLQEGSNVARFVARDAAGNESEASTTVYYVLPPTTTTTTAEKEEGKETQFTAYATFGSCAETPPYDVYYGTGVPGSLIEVGSEYGSGVVEVGPEGHWEIKVIFAEAVPGKAFKVTVTDEFGHKAQFEFVHTP